LRTGGTRLGRKVNDAVTAYLELEPDLRKRFESGLLAARDALSTADEIPANARKALLEAIAMAFVEGYVGGAWGKVHLALAESAPGLYEAVKELLPNAKTGSHPLAL
jgi:hypothetical protein